MLAKKEDEFLVENIAMQELHKIRENLFEETKNMNASDKIAYLNVKAEEVQKEMRLE